MRRGLGIGGRGRGRGGMTVGVLAAGERARGAAPGRGALRRRHHPLLLMTQHLLGILEDVLVGRGIRRGGVGRRLVVDQRHLGRRARRLTEALLGQLGEHRRRVAAVEHRPFLDRTVQQQAAAELVDAPRHALAGLLDHRQHRGLDARIVVPADHLQPVHDIGRRLFLVQRVQMRRRGHALAQLFEPRVLQLVAQPLLTDQKDLQQRPTLVLQVGQHAQLLHRAEAQVLRLVDDQQRRPPLLVRPREQLLEPLQHGRGVEVLDIDAELVGRRAQDVVAVQHRVDHRGDQIVGRPVVGEQVVDQGCLAHPRRTGHDHEALGRLQRILHVGPPLGEAGVAVAEGVIRTQAERVAAESIEGLVHRCRFNPMTGGVERPTAS